ncbi:IS1202 transposase [Streptococcus pneumoniae]|nr:IS1202 transposase [Streptococcus pneumoniae]
MNETKKYLVIKAIAQGKKTKKRACVELNLSERQINRLLLAYQQKGKEAFRHGNRNRKPKHAIPDEIKERILKKYLSYETYKPNVLHFCELLAEEEGIKLSDTTVRKILFEQEPEQKKERRKYIPPQTHPWKLTSFKQYLHKNKKDYEEFTSEELHSPQLQV